MTWQQTVHWYFLKSSLFLIINRRIEWLKKIQYESIKPIQCGKEGGKNVSFHLLSRFLIFSWNVKMKTLSKFCKFKFTHLSHYKKNSVKREYAAPDMCHKTKLWTNSLTPSLSSTSNGSKLYTHTSFIPHFFCCWSPPLVPLA